MRGTMAVLGVCALLLGGCTAGGPEDGRTPVVIDTDMGQDDMMAILYLLQHPDVRVEAITVSGTGLAHCEPGIRIALSLLELAAAPEDVPVACGPQEPLPGTYPYPGAFPTSWRQITDDAYGIELPETVRTPDERRAPELLADAIGGAGAPVKLLTLGPLTDVAVALRDRPELVDDLAGVIVMGGAVDVPGNVIRNGVAEFNVWVDPVAAETLLGSGAQITLVPLDATNQVPVTAFFADALADHHVTPEADTVHALFEAQPWLTEGGYFFWDPLAATLVTDPWLASLEEHRLSVLEGEKETQGQTVVDPAGAPVASDGCRYEGPSSLAAGDHALAIQGTVSTTLVAVVRLGGGRTVHDLIAWLEARGDVVRDEPPWWIRGVSFGDASTPLVPMPLSPGPHAVVCVDEEDRSVEVVAPLDVPA